MFFGRLLIFFKISFLVKTSFRNTIRVSNSFGLFVLFDSLHPINKLSVM